MGNGDINRENSNPWQTQNSPNKEKEEGMRLWGIFLFGLIGATATTFAVSLSPGSLSISRHFYYRRYILDLSIRLIEKITIHFTSESMKEPLINEKQKV